MEPAFLHFGLNRLCCRVRETNLGDSRRAFQQNMVIMWDVRPFYIESSHNTVQAMVCSATM